MSEPKLISTSRLMFDFFVIGLIIECLRLFYIWFGPGRVYLHLTTDFGNTYGILEGENRFSSLATKLKIHFSIAST